MKTRAQNLVMRSETTSGVEEVPPTFGKLPNGLMTAFEVAEFVGCHEETVRRAYQRVNVHYPKLRWGRFLARYQHVLIYSRDGSWLSAGFPYFQVGYAAVLTLAHVNTPFER
jgi:hypothetical protein